MARRDKGSKPAEGSSNITSLGSPVGNKKQDKTSILSKPAEDSFGINVSGSSNIRRVGPMSAIATHSFLFSPPLIVRAME